MQAKKTGILDKFSSFCVADPDPVKHAVELTLGLHVHWQVVILMYDLKYGVNLSDGSRMGKILHFRNVG
jgi:hypothetical protein